MERVVVIEVTDQQGRLVERFRASRFPVRIGRAYDNDLIVADPYVCPHHCEVALGEEGEMLVNDLSSVNGTFAQGVHSRSGQHALKAGSQLRIGRTLLHIRFPQPEVEATRIDTTPHSRRDWPPRSLSVNLTVLLLGALMMTLWDYLDSYTEFDYGRYFFGQQIPAVIAVAGWAAVWSIVSRITAQRFAFLRHATILVSFILGITLSDYLLEFLKFGFAASWPFEMISIVILMVGLALLLYWHLRLCSDQRRSRLMIVATVIAVVFVGLVQINDYLDQQEFRSAPRFSTTLKPPAFQLVRSKPVDDFLSDVQPLRGRIEQELDAQRSKAKAQAMAEVRPEK